MRVHLFDDDAEQREIILVKAEIIERRAEDVERVLSTRLKSDAPGRGKPDLKMVLTGKYDEHWRYEGSLEKKDLRNGAVTELDASAAEKAEKALSSRDESTAAAAVTAAASQGAQAKRAAAAETLVQEVAAKLQASEKRCRDLEWQVSMLVDKSELGGGSGGVQKGGSNGTGGPGAVAGGDAPRGPGQWLQKAIKGCVAPRPGRGSG